LRKNHATQPKGDHEKPKRAVQILCRDTQLCYCKARLTGARDARAVGFSRFRKAEANRRIQKSFNTWDKDKNGESSLSVLRTALNGKDNAFSKHEIQDLMKVGDVGGNGTLNFKEALE